MTMALAVAIVACQGAAGVPGEPGAPGAPGAPAATPEPEPETPEPETPTDPTVDHTLDVGKTQSVSVENAVAADTSSTALTVTQGTPPMWTIKAVTKGTASVLFYDASLTLLKTIKVKVSNQAPTVKKTALPKLPLELYYDANADQPTDVLRSVYLVVATGKITAQPFAGYFDEKDAADKPKLTFTISSAQPQYAVVAAYKKDGSEVYVDVTHSPSNVTKIYLNVSVSDGTATSESVQIQVKLPSAILDQNYMGDQSTAGVVKDITVEYRPGMTHLISGVLFWNTATELETTIIGPYADKLPDATINATQLLVSVPASSSISVVTGDGGSGIEFKTSGVGTTTVTMTDYMSEEIMPSTAPQTYKWTADADRLAITFRVIVNRPPENPVVIE